MNLELQFLPAAEGDAVWIRWDGNRQMLVDLGREATGTAFRRRLEKLPPERRHFELLVVTHVDADHIGGVLTGLADAGPLEGLGFGDIWFNGWAHLRGDLVPESGATELEAMGPVQGERLTSWLAKPWNEAFGRGPVQRSSPPHRIELPGGVCLTVLGPPAYRLTAFQRTWREEVRRALAKGTLSEVPPGYEALGRPEPVQPDLASWDDLERLANTPSKPDTAEANGSSICLLLEWEGRRVLLTGDAWAPDVVDALRLLGEPFPVALDVVKLPHHGSEANLSTELADAISCPRWVFSTNGSRFYHPDAAAVARVLRGDRQPRPELWFNVPSRFNAWWTDPDWQSRFDYTTVTGSEHDGATIPLTPRPST